ncbi:D-alanine--D-alanine ligase [Clostridia bacterium]|nr:D-alanine--D-alanine ligase [Clostridia bacterium]
MKTNVAVFLGGRSVEHEVSIISAMQAIAALDAERYNPVPVYITKDGRLYSGKDFTSISAFRDIPALLKKGYPVVLTNSGNGTVMSRYPAKFGTKETPLHVALPVVHGTYSEDGTVAGLCEAVALPYAGCDVLSAALSMNKHAAKAVLRASGLPVLDGILLNSAKHSDNTPEIIEKSFEYPMIVKPADLGSSVGISKVSDRKALRDALELAFKFTLNVLIEPCLNPMKEVNCAVLGDWESARASVCERPFSGDEFLSYQDKYLSGGKTNSGKGMGSGGRELPAKLSAEITKRVQELSVAAFNALGCSGCARVDCMIDGDGQIYINELNTIPGSLSFYLWEASGLSFSALLDEMLRLALKRRRVRDALMTTIPTNILAQKSGLKGAKL